MEGSPCPRAGDPKASGLRSEADDIDGTGGESDPDDGSRDSDSESDQGLARVSSTDSTASEPLGLTPARPPSRGRGIAGVASPPGASGRSGSAPPSLRREGGREEEGGRPEKAVPERARLTPTRGYPSGLRVGWMLPRWGGTPPHPAHSQSHTGTHTLAHTHTHPHAHCRIHPDAHKGTDEHFPLPHGLYTHHDRHVHCRSLMDSLFFFYEYGYSRRGANNKKKEEMPSLFDPYLSILKDLIFESWGSIRNDSLKNKVKIYKAKIELKAFLPLMIKVYRNAVTLQLKGIKVANADKVFSVFETHTDILVKGQRKVEFGHKVLITRGSSNIILDHKVFEGNPSDKELLLPSIVNIKANYNRTPQSTSNDGGFCSNANLEGCKKLGLINIVFTKVTKSLQNIVSIPELEIILKKWRGTTEAVISNLKRGFDLQRVTWEGFEGFCSKVAWSVLGYNLRVMANRILA